MSSEKKNNDYLLEVEHLKQYFPVHQGFSTIPLKAVDDISFAIHFFAHDRFPVRIHDHFSVFVILFSTVKKNVSVKRNLTCRWLVQPKQCPPYRCLSTTGLANQTKCFSRADGNEQ